jgi:formamidopyrimidine-DNA glycosylase
MPELPEVEVTRRRIVDKLIGRRIAKVRTTKPSYFFLTPPATLRTRLEGRTCVALARHGKYLLAELDDGARLFLHLGMTGQLFTASARSVRLLNKSAALDPNDQGAFSPDEHTHLVLEFADGGEHVLFRDVRKFGKVRWLAQGKGDARLEKLGPDALTVSADLLFDESRKRKVAVKSFLLDQSVLAGVGNIYADEALFRAKVRPKRAAKSLSRAECEALSREIRGVLERSIETGGSSIDDYVQPDGTDGAYQNERKVYARGGEPCSVCKTPIKRIVIGARSTCYCPSCQG